MHGHMNVKFIILYVITEYVDEFSHVGTSL